MDRATADITAKLSTSETLINKLDLEKWPDEDVKIFNAIISDKRQLEREHHIRSAMQAGVRPQLRNLTTEDLISNTHADWRYDKDTAGYRYNRKGCALSRGVKNCAHDICKEAKSKEGITYLEYDTIIHYAQRIAKATRPRIKDALQKQRDIQLIKDKQEIVEWKEKACKKFKYLGKDAYQAITAAAEMFDPSLASPYKPAPESVDNVVERIGRTLSRLRINCLDKQEKEFLSVATDLLSSTDPNYSLPNPGWHWRNHLQFFPFFRDVFYNHLEAAIGSVSFILDLNSTVTYETDYKLRSFHEEICHLMSHAERDVRCRKWLTVEKALQSLVQRVGNETKDAKNIKDKLPEGYFYHALQRCATIETAARDRATKVVSAGTIPAPGREIKNTLSDVLAVALAKSPFPSMTHMSLDHDLKKRRYSALVGYAIDLLRGGINEQDLKNEMICYFVHDQFAVDPTRALPEYDPQSLDEFANDLRRVYKDSPHFPVVLGILDQVKECVASQPHGCLACIVTFDRSESGSKTGEKVGPPGHQPPRFLIQWLPGMKRDDPNIHDQPREEFVRDFANNALSNGSFVSLMRPLLARGATESFDAYLRVLNYTGFIAPGCDTRIEDMPELEYLLATSKDLAKTFGSSKDALQLFFNDRYREGFCATKTMVILAMMLPSLAAYNPDTVKAILQSIKDITRDKPTAIQEDWLPSVSSMGRLIVETYGILMLETVRVFQQANVDIFVLSCIWIMMYLAFITSDVSMSVQRSSNLMSYLVMLLKVSREKASIVYLTDILQKTVSASVLCQDPQNC